LSSSNHKLYYLGDAIVRCMGKYHDFGLYVYIFRPNKLIMCMKRR
jgi:hypothetical protein